MKSKGKGLYWLVIKSCKHSLYFYIKKTDERHYKAFYNTVCSSSVDIFLGIYTVTMMASKCGFFGLSSNSL
jgi:uncharacterized membrane protein YiaA